MPVFTMGAVPTFSASVLARPRVSGGGGRFADATPSKAQALAIARTATAATSAGVPSVVQTAMTPPLQEATPTPLANPSGAVVTGSTQPMVAPGVLPLETSDAFVSPVAFKPPPPPSVVLNSPPAVLDAQPPVVPSVAMFQTRSATSDDPSVDRQVPHYIDLQTGLPPWAIYGAVGATALLFWWGWSK